MNRILQNLNLCAGMGEKVRDDGHDELLWACSKVAVKQSAESDDNPFLWDLGDKLYFTCVPDLQPCLVDPAIGGSGFALKIRMAPECPIRLIFHARQMMLGDVEKDWHPATR